MHIIYAYADFINITSTPHGREATRRSAGDGRVGCGRRNHANLVRRQRPLASLTLEELESVFSLLRESYSTILIQRSSEDLRLNPNVLPMSQWCWGVVELETL